MKFTIRQKMILYVCGIVVMFMVLYANLFITKDYDIDSKEVTNKKVNIYNQD